MQAHFNPVSVWMRGLLQEEYGVDVRSLKVRTNAGSRSGLGAARVDGLPAGRSGRVDERVASGEIDAYMLPDVVESVREGAAQSDASGPTIARPKPITSAGPASFRFGTPW